MAFPKCSFLHTKSLIKIWIKAETGTGKSMLDLWLCSYNAPVPAPPAYSAQGEGSCECSIMGKRTALGVERCRGRGKVCEHEHISKSR